MVNPEYIGTKRVCKSGDSSVVYIEKQWDFKRGDFVNIHIYRLDDPEKITYTGTKKLSHVGSGSAFFLEKTWGFTPGDMVVIRIQKRGTN